MSCPRDSVSKYENDFCFRGVWILLNTGVRAAGEISLKRSNEAVRKYDLEKIVTFYLFRFLVPPGGRQYSVISGLNRAVSKHLLLFLLPTDDT